MHLILTITVCYTAGIFALIWQMRKIEARNTGQKDGSHLDFNGQPTTSRKNLAFIVQRLQWSSPKFARFITPPPPFHSALFIPGAGGAGPADTWRAASPHRVGAPHSKGPAECCLRSHTVFLSRPCANMLLYKYRKPCTICSVPSWEGLWWRAQLSHHIGQRPASRLWSWAQAYMRSHTVSKPSNNVHFLCSVDFMIRLNSLNLYRQWSFHLHWIWGEWVHV